MKTMRVYSINKPKQYIVHLLKTPKSTACGVSVGSLRAHGGRWEHTNERMNCKACEQTNIGARYAK